MRILYITFLVAVNFHDKKGLIRKTSKLKTNGLQTLKILAIMSYHGSTGLVAPYNLAFKFTHKELQNTAQQNWLRELHLVRFPPNKKMKKISFF